MTDTASNSTMRYELVADTTGPVPHETPIALVHRVLRGRVAFTICVMGLLGAVGGVLGYTTVKPKFESTGLLNFKGALPTLLYDNGEATAGVDFNSFVSTQIEYLRSAELLDAAIQHPDLRAIDWPEGPAGVARLQGMTDIRRERGTQVVRVTASHGEPFVAQTAVNALLSTYARMGVDPTIDSITSREAALLRRETELVEQIAQARTEVLERTGQYGVDGLTAMHASKVTELIEIEGRLAELRLTAARLASGEEIPDLAIGGAIDNGIARQAMREQEILAELRTYDGRFGPVHPLVRELQQELESVRTQMTIERGFGHEPRATTVAEASQLRVSSLIRDLEQLRADLEAEVAGIGQRRAAVAALAAREDHLDRQLAATQHHLDLTRMEIARDDRERVQIAAWGDFPLGPSSDRRTGLAAAGALLGSMGGVALVILIGVIDPRARFVPDLAVMHDAPVVLGALPELDRRAITRARANRTVHQLRNLLEIKTADPDRNVFAVTSASGGEGRTSVALGLAASFAAADRRTLLIDADINDGGVTQELGLQNAPGLCEAIGPEGMTGRVHTTRRPNLWAMPSGLTTGVDARDLSHTKLEALLDALRGRFDAIVVDTGAVRTSVEAGLVTSLADRTILVVERQQRISIIEDTLARLRQTGAALAGIVFNRALAGDFRDEATVIRHEKRSARRGGPAHLVGGVDRTAPVSDTGPSAIAAAIGTTETTDADMTPIPTRRRAA